MTYYGPKEMAAAFRTVRGNTVKIAAEIPEEQYSFRPAPGSRSVAESLAHIAVGPRFQLKVHGERLNTLDGFDFPPFVQQQMAEEKTPRSKAQILELLHAEGEKFAAYLEGLSEAFLAEQVRMPEGAQPASKSRFEMLISPKEHEMHHRGQLMLVERMIGLTPHLTRQMQERMAAAQSAQSGR